MNLLLDPHGDDAVLFAAYTCLRERPLVLVTHMTVPFGEVMEGCYQIGCEARQIMSEDAATHLRSFYSTAEKVYAPMIRPDGHEEHNEVGRLALDVYGPERVVHYLTYAPRGQRDRDGVEVVPTAIEIACKLIALAEFLSQIEQATTRPWFYDLLDMREWESV